MRYLYSQLPKDKYLAAMKQKFESPFRIFDGRLTGFVIGSFFAVAHYQPYEWNRKVTSECNRAYGFVKEADGELEISFIRGKGMLSPGWFLLLTLLCEGVFLLASGISQIPLGGTGWLLSAIIAFGVCAGSAIEACLTENGQAGAWEISKFLENPEDYYC